MVVQLVASQQEGSRFMASWGLSVGSLQVLRFDSESHVGENVSVNL